MILCKGDVFKFESDIILRRVSDIGVFLTTKRFPNSSVSYFTFWVIRDALYCL
jgi:hypothetical protein